MRIDRFIKVGSPIFSLLLGVSLFTVSCAHLPAEFSLKEPPKAPGAEKLAGKKGALVLLQKTEIEFLDGGRRFKETTYVQIKAVDERGLKYVQKAKVFFLPGNMRVQNFAARLLRPNGWSSLSRRSYTSSLRSPSLRGVKYKGISIPHPALPGSVLEYRFERIGDSFFLSPLFLQRLDGLAIAKLEITLKLPGEFTVRTKFLPSPNFPADQLKRTKKTVDDTEVIVWEASGIPGPTDKKGLHRRALTAKLLLIPEKVGLSGKLYPFNSWADIAEFYQAMEGKAAEPTPEIAEFTKKLLKGANSNRKKIERIFSFVKEEIRYVPLAGLGLGRFKPQSAADTLERRFGDCKAKVALLSAMLKTVGIEAVPALVRTKNLGPYPKDFPAFYFNHTAAYLPSFKGGLFLDPSARDGSPNSPPKNIAGTLALIAGGKNKGQLVKIPSPQKREKLSYRNGK